MEEADIEIGESPVPHDLVNFIIDHPEAARSLDKSAWDTLDGGAWSHLLRSRPEFADKCDWGEVTNVDWVELLRERPEFVELCKDESWKSGIWKALDERDWEWLLDAQPQLAKFKPAK